MQELRIGVDCVNIKNKVTNKLKFNYKDLSVHQLYLIILKTRINTKRMQYSPSESKRIQHRKNYFVRNTFGFTLSSGSEVRYLISTRLHWQHYGIKRIFYK